MFTFVLDSSNDVHGRQDVRVGRFAGSVSSRKFSAALVGRVNINAVLILIR